MKELLKLKKFWVAVVTIIVLVASIAIPESRASIIQVGDSLLEIINAIDWSVLSDAPVEPVAEVVAE